MSPTYYYQVVSCNGAGVHGPEHRSLAKAREAAQRCAERDKRSSVPLGPYEIERIYYPTPHSRRYWVRRKSRWVPWDPRLDADQRQPDFIVGGAA